MRPTVYPTYVNLKELDEPGESFLYSRSTGELNKALADLIQAHDYDVNLHLRPMGNAYEISGKITTVMTLSCARCGRDMENPIQDQFQELIVIMPEPPKGGHSGHTGSQEHGPFCNYATSYQFDLAEFVHEHVAANEPYRPLCARPDCEEHLQRAQDLKIATEKELTPNPFEVLKNIQIKPSQKG
jgi:uncharacterized metal-binding protein YceD (DUF177 family)